MKAILWILGALAVVAGLFKSLSSGAVEAQSKPRTGDSTFVVRRGDLKISVAEQGSLKAKNSVKIEPGFQRNATITKLVREGDAVKKDDILAEFDKTDLETQLQDLDNQLIRAQSDLTSARTEFEIQKRDSAASVENAEFSHKKSLMNLEKYEKGDQPNDLRKIQLAAEKARSDFQRKTEQFKSVPDLEKEGFITKIQVEEERIQLREYELNLESAEKSLELYNVYTDPIARADLENTVRGTERDLVNARARAEDQLRQKEQIVKGAEGLIKSTEARLKKLRSELEKMTVKAPADGIALYGDPEEGDWWRERIKVGAQWNGGNTLITLPDLREMQLDVFVHEADIGLIKKDMEAIVTVETFKGRSFKGKVTEIATTASEDWRSDARRFKVKIEIEPFTDVEVRAKTTAKAEIQVEELKGVLHVPIHAIVAEDGGHFAFVPKGDTFEKRAVKIGKNNLHYVEILEGLAESEAVLLYDPRSSSLSETKKDGAQEKTLGDSIAPAAGASKP